MKNGQSGKEDAETEFLTGLIELSYGQEVVDKLKKTAERVSWAKDWPNSTSSFWNAEAFMWQHKIEKEKRELIKRELAFLEGRLERGNTSGKNLDLGCGSFSYLKSIGFDCSEKMLQFNENCLEKVVGDLEQKLPFAEEEFPSITAIFVFNYIKNYFLLLSEMKRILQKNGIAVVVLSSSGVQDWQRQKEVNHLSVEEWQKIMVECGFMVDFLEKEGLWFFRLKKN